MYSEFWGIIFGLFGSLGLLIALFRGILRSKVNFFIFLLLLIYSIDAIFINLHYPFSFTIPAILLSIYVITLNLVPSLFDSIKGSKKVALFEELLNGMQKQGVDAITTFGLISELFSKGNKFANFDCNDIIAILGKKINYWSKKYYSDKEIRESEKNEKDISETDTSEIDDCGYLASSALICIANISVSNKIEKGKYFLKDYMQSASNYNYSDDVIKMAFPLIKEILSTNQPKPIPLKV